jgi:predicted transcriptional regulator
MDDRSVAEAISYLSGSSVRIELLALLRDGRVLDRGELRSEIDAARTTVSRNVEGLVERGWVAADGGGYAMTAVGAAVYDRYDDLHRTVGVADRLEPLLRHVPVGTLDLPVYHLADASLYTAAAGDPWAMVNAHVDRIRDGSPRRLVTPITSRHAIEACRDAVAGGAALELVVPPAVAATYRDDPEYRSLIEELLDADRTTVAVCDDRPPFYVGLFEAAAQIGVDEGGRPRALLDATAAPVVDWAASWTADWADGATPWDRWRRAE